MTCAVALGLGLANSANATTITFDNLGLSHSDQVTSATSDDGLVTASSITASGGINQAWAFDTNLSNTRDSDLEGPFSEYNGTGTFDAGIALIIQENSNTTADDVAGGGSITFIFSTVVSFLGFTALDDGRFTVSSTDTTATFTENLHVPNADGKYKTVSTGSLFSAVSNLTFTLDHSGAIDSLVFSTPTNNTQVPLPATLPLLLAGMLGVGLKGRRRRKS